MDIQIKSALIGAIIPTVGAFAIFFLGDFSTQSKLERDTVKVLSEKFDSVEKDMSYEDALQAVFKENEDLKNKFSDYKSQINDLESQSKDLSEKLGIANGELDDVPVIKYKDCGLSIDGEEKTVDKEKSSVSINGNPYYSKEFFDNLLPSNKSAIEKDGMLYIGKIVKEKSNLFDMKVIRASNSVDIEESSKDTYGNIYNKTVIFTGSDDGVTFNTNREYSKLKCTLAVLDENDGGGVIQIESEKKILYTSKEITSTTEPFEIDIPINNASQITIKQISGDWTCNMVANAIVYNQE